MQTINPLAGYSVAPTDRQGVFKVVRPSSRGGGFYLVNYPQQTCNCQAKGRCKHLDGLQTLVFSVASLLTDLGQVDEAALLLSAWAEAIVLRAAISGTEHRRAA